VTLDATCDRDHRRTRKSYYVERDYQPVKSGRIYVTNERLLFVGKDHQHQALSLRLPPPHPWARLRRGLHPNASQTITRRDVG
jgi:hypothetical protein